MLLILSPAKTQDFSKSGTGFQTEPLFKTKTATLVEHLQKSSPEELAHLLKISPKLALLNFDRYQYFDPQHYTQKNSKASIMAYQGDVYQGLDAASLNQADLDFANQHLLMLSGLYGALRPLDAMQPYRLEMATRLATSDSKDLYSFWQQILTDYLNTRLKTEKALINLASQEYSKAIDRKNLQGNMIDIEFQDWNKDRFKVIGILAKRARGMMARFIIQNRLNQLDQLQTFNTAGYTFQESLSSKHKYVFQRE